MISSVTSSLGAPFRHGSGAVGSAREWKVPDEEGYRGAPKAGDPLRRMGGEQTDKQAAMSEALAKVAVEHGTEGSVTAIALAYIIQKSRRLGIYNVFPIVGGRKVEQLRDNIGALSITLTTEQVAYLESIHPFDTGFPASFIGPDPNITGSSAMLSRTEFLTFPQARE